MNGEISEMSAYLAHHGVTSFIPTTITSPIEDLRVVAEKVLQVIREKRYVSQVIGLNLEGPWISRDKPGSQPVEHIKKAEIEEFDEINVGKVVKIITIAPEGNLNVIKEISQRGVITSIGHSNADYETAKEAIAMGARLSTHTFNAMRAFNHREPGILGAVLESAEIYCEVIPDLIHVHPSVLKILIKLKGIDETILITDGIEAAGLGDGEYELSLGRVNIKDGACRLEDGTLAGSTLILDQGMRNIVNLGVNLKDAVKMVTTNPATLLGIDDRKGSIEIGKDADIVILNKDLEVDGVIINGEIVR